MKFLKWQQGRQNATRDVEKLLIWNKKWFDLYVLYLPKGKVADWHFDVVENKNHHRINITVWGLWRFWFKKQVEFFGHKKEYPSFEWNFPFRFKKFRPDVTEHKAEIFKNSVVISIGWVTNKS